jgi:hypothetical protein
VSLLRAEPGLGVPRESRQSGVAGEELLHGGLFEVALLGDEPVEGGEQGIHVAHHNAFA